MSIMDRATLPVTLAEAANEAGSAGTIAVLSELLEAELNNNEILTESLADVELAMEDRSWERIGEFAEREFSRAGLHTAGTMARVFAVAHPLIKRGLALRNAYVWGQGVSIAARATGENDDNGAEQDVNTVVQDFLDDESNRAALTSSQAREELERSGLGCDGNVMLACFTSRLTGRVQVRSILFDEIQDVITNPEDRDEPWFYLREWTTMEVREFVPVSGERTTRSREVSRKAFYPALGFRPPARPRSINGIEVVWDAPVLHISVNRHDGWKFGIGDAYASLAWARMYQDFLADWAKLVKALSKFAWRLTGDKGSKARTAAARIRSATNGTTAEGTEGADRLTGTVPGTSAAGATAAYGPGAQLEAIPKSGATIDSQSGKPLAAMIAAGLGVPLTMLLADPGITGARATADTLDKPTELEAGGRQQLWADAYRRLLDYVVDSAVRAPQGPLKGTVRRTPDGREMIELAGETARTIDVAFPELSGISVETLMTAIETADTIGVPLEVLIRLALEALGVDDVDEILADMRDEQGNIVDPRQSAGQAATDAFRRGEDPARAVAPPTPDDEGDDEGA